ncbi:MAG: ADP-forming succinate--CoA ligase subunit beta [Pseudomonadota bacterium]
MNIHEYQAKALLREYGIPVAPGYPVFESRDVDAVLARLATETLVVKSQIHAGGRGKGRFRELGQGAGGGVRLARSAKEAHAHVKEMLGRHLVTRQTGSAGKRVDCLYLEEGADIARELYLSILVDRERGQVCFIASNAGGMDIEAVAAQTPEAIVTVAIDPEAGCTEHDANQLCQIFHLEDAALDDGMRLFPDLYRAFLDNDMSLLEINPLVCLGNGRLRVLDAKVSFDDNALFRHPNLQELRDAGEEDPREAEATEHDLAYIALDGTIGCMVNGAGLAMATMDIIKLYGGEPANFLDVGGGATVEKVTAAFKIITQDAKVRGILVNIFGGIMRCDVIASGIVEAVRETGLQVPLVVRLEGTKVAEGKQIIAESGLDVITADDLDDAAQKIVAAL